ncbi:peptidase inhibitor family I36 protein [Kutzneria sp. NPDC051319]|uniref:peptidase inhibitor family I36 protein n=1 Tax=Kutzneria sp. NPDC051319 TaxID=3155047 RepID=UPI0034425D03
MTTWGKRVIRTTLAAGAATALAVSLAGTATAATPTRNGVCETGEFCLYYGPGLTGSVSDFTTSIPTYGDHQPTCYEFKGPGLGQGKCVWRNAVSALNLTSGIVRLYTHTSCTGAERWVIRPNDSVGNLSPLANQNESQSLDPSGNC